MFLVSSLHFDIVFIGRQYYFKIQVSVIFSGPVLGLGDPGGHHLLNGGSYCPYIFNPYTSLTFLTFKKRVIKNCIFCIKKRFQASKQPHAAITMKIPTIFPRTPNWLGPVSGPTLILVLSHFSQQKYYFD